MDDIKSAFLSFIDCIPFYGMAVLCLDNEPIQDLIPKIKKRITTYGMNSQADIQARDISFEGFQSQFNVIRNGEKLGVITLNLPGAHNVSNALASIAVGLELELPFTTIKKALEKVEGVQRRLEIKGFSKGITVVDDYGHHPTEIKTTLAAVKESWPDRRIVVVFQPHRFTRTQALFSEFSRSFYQSDGLIVLPIYSAGEKEIKGVDSFQLSEEIRAHGHKNVIFFETFNAAESHLVDTLESGDILITFGAGDVWKLGEAVLKKLHDESLAMPK
jgi:UDP-N-acetylmuramate--alanine ligase